MIICVFNHYFPHNSGFGNRCMREILALSKLDEVTIVCRQDAGQKKTDLIPSKANPINIIRFSAKSEVVHRPEGYRGTGWYEIKRNLDLMWGLISTLAKVMYRSQKPVELYAVTSPLTTPLFCLFLALFFGVRRKLVSFHDLEPELAMHLKKIPKNHWLVWLELKLEWFVCHTFEKILVTTDAQAETLSHRTKTPISKYCVIENVMDLGIKTQKRAASFRKAGDSFVIAYMSTISFDYTIEGFKDFLTDMKPLLQANKKVQVVVIGSGEGLNSLIKFILDMNLGNSVSCVGHVENPTPYLKSANLAIIPWKKDIMTETMLPTKLFEYLSLGLPVVAPNFGEFKRVLNSGTNAVLYASTSELLAGITQLISNDQLRKKIGQGGKSLFDSRYRPDLLDEKLIAFYQTK